MDRDIAARPRQAEVLRFEMQVASRVMWLI